MSYGHVLFGLGNAGGCYRIGSVDPSPGTVVGDPDLLTVSDTAVNGHDGGVLAASLRQGGEIALQLAHRTFRIWEPINVLEIEIGDLGDCDAHGSSADLALGVATYLALAKRQKVDLSDVVDFAATGTLDNDGKVGPVDSVASKVRAALNSGLAAGSKVFYPSASQRQVDIDLQAACKARGVELVPVACIEDVLDKLKVRVERAWRGNPYRGLEAYSGEHGPVFFGREREVGEVLARLDERVTAKKPGLLIIGASGAGKSSFCLAGVVPALQRQTPNLEWAVWRPRDAAVSGSGEHLDTLAVDTNLLAAWRRTGSCPGSGGGAYGRPASLDEILDQITAKPEQRRILIVDQFEELFTLGFPQEVQLAFARVLSRLQEAGVWVIATLRSEFYLAFTQLRDADRNALLTPLFDENGRYDLLHMDRVALRQVITGPARMAGLGFEGANASHAASLDDRMLAEALTTDDTLPLLSFVLDRVYEDLVRRKSDGSATSERVAPLLTHAAYDAEGGLRGAIGRRAAEAFAGLDPEAQGALREVLEALAVPAAEKGKETARPAPLEQWPPSSPAGRLIDALHAPDVRVLVSERDYDNRRVIRVAHEALLVHWDAAAKLLKDTRDERIIVEDLRKRSEAWATAETPGALLLRAPQDLGNARKVRARIRATADDNALVAFLDRSLANEQRRKWTLRGFVIAALLVLATLTAWALIGQREARAAEVRAQTEASKAKKAEEVARRSQRDTVNALLEANTQTKLAQLRERIAREARADQLRQTQIARQRAHEAELARADAAQQLAIAKEQRSKAVAALAEAAIDSGQPMKGILLALSQVDGDGANLSGDLQTALLHGLVQNRELATLRGHTATVASAAFSPDGGRIVTASEDHTVRVWTKDGRRWTSVPLEGHTMAVTSAAFSPDGRRIITASWDKTARVWSEEGGRWTSIPLEGHTDVVMSAAFSIDGQLIVTASSDKTARVWHEEGGRWTSVVLEGHENAVISATFSPDRRYIVTASADYTARVWHKDGRRWASVPLEGHLNIVNGASFSPDGQYIVTSSNDATARIWREDQGRWISVPLKGHTGWVVSATFSPDGRRIVTASSDETARVWREEGGHWTSVLLDGHLGNVVRANFSPDGRAIVTASNDRTARIWREVDGRWISVMLARHIDWVTSAAFSPDGRHVVTASNDQTARMWTEVQGHLTSIPLVGHGAGISSAVFSSDGRRIVTASFDSTARVWSEEDGRWTFVLLNEHKGWGTRAAFSPDGRRFVATSDRFARVWSKVGNRWTSVTLEGHTDDVNWASFSPDGRRIVTASQDRTARVWSEAGGRWTSVPLQGHTNAVTRAIFSPDGRSIVTASYDNTARVWSEADGRWSPVTLQGHTDLVISAAFSPNGQSIVTASRDNTARVWSKNGGRWTSVPLAGHRGGLTSAAFSPDGRRIVTASDDGTARVWSEEGSRWNSVLLEGHTEGIGSATFSPEGRRIVTASQDGAVRAWSEASGRWTSVLLGRHTSIVTGAEFSPDGRHMLTGSYDQTARIWNVPTGSELVSLARSAVTRCLTDDERASAGLDRARSGECR